MTLTAPMVIDDLLPRDMFEFFSHTIMTCNEYNLLPFTAHPSENTMHGDKLHETQAQAIMYTQINECQVVKSYTWHDLTPCINKLNEALGISKLYLARVNVTFAATKQYLGNYHVDMKNHCKEKNLITCCYYLNDNNGQTTFRETGQKVSSKANRAVVFPHNMEHALLWNTDTKLRYVLNLNYETE